MSTINDKRIIDKIIKQHGFYENDPRVAQIVEYTSQWGNTCYGVTWVTEAITRQMRYEYATDMVRNPKIIYSLIHGIGLEGNEKPEPKLPF